MTTEQPTAPRALRRRGDERVLGGVASGIADYFNVDPLLVRIAFVGLMVFNGLGLLLYLAAWLLIPADTDDQSVVQRVLAARGTGRVLLVGALILIGAIVLINVPASTYVTPFGVGLNSGGLEIALIAIIAIVIGAVLVRRPEPGAAVGAASAPAADAPQPTSLAQRVFGGMSIGGVIAAALVGIALVMLWNGPGQYASVSGAEWIGTIALIAIAVGAALYWRQQPAGTVAAGTEATTSAEPAPPVRRVVVRRRPRPQSPLGWYVLGAMLVGIGLLAIVTGINGTAVDPGRYFGLALAVVGIGLVVGAWWGHARLLILLGLLLLPFAFAASLISVPFEGGFGSHYAAPTSAAELRDEYRLAGGQLTFDLTQFEETGEPIEITATVAMGEVTVWLPPEAGLEVDAAVGGGSIWMVDRVEEGTNVSERRVIEGDGQQFVMHLEAGLGAVRVEYVDWENR